MSSAARKTAFPLRFSPLPSKPDTLIACRWFCQAQNKENTGFFAYTACKIALYGYINTQQDIVLLTKNCNNMLW
ncbi:MAG: hypothetical protein E7056_00945 [Lentisphaerae bacterium]|nr:hypothetical protein [Lentisphaerota bacterium]